MENYYLHINGEDSKIRALSSAELKAVNGGSMRWINKKLREIRHTVEDVAMIGLTVLTGVVIGNEAVNKYGSNSNSKKK